MMKIIAAILLAILPISLFAYSEKTIKVQNIDGAIFIKTVKDRPYDVVLFDDKYTLKSAIKILSSSKVEK